MENKLKVLFVAAECSPWIKVGGLGDVAGELPLQLKDMGVDITVVIPASKDIDAATKYKGDFPVNMALRSETCIVREVINAPVQTYLMDNYQYFGRSGVYGHKDDDERFAFFCLSVFEMLRHFEYKPDVIHLNDWHSAPLAMLLREKERENPDFSDIAILYTIHSLEYQGISKRNIFDAFCVRDVVFKLDKVEYYGCFSAMKAGLNYADIINSVSKTYANQMLTPEFGFGMEGVLLNRKSRIRGVVNGINTISWDPETDPLIYANYSKEKINGKIQNKKNLQTEFGLKQSEAPLFAVVSRLVQNKGLDLMLDAAHAILHAGGQFILLGSGEKYYENAFLELLDNYPGAVSINLEFNNEKAHKIYAGSDIFLMPSRHEPCGLSQLIAMRYGSIPLVHKTGGLADTVIDEIRNKGRGTGFSFGRYSPQTLLNVIKRIERYYKNKDNWSQLIYRAMSRDSSWEKPATEYISLYREAIHESLGRKSKVRKKKVVNKVKKENIENNERKE